MRANELKNGMAVVQDGKVYVVTRVEHTKPGKGPAYMQVKMKEVGSGANVDRRFNATEQVESTTLDRRPMEFLYTDADGYVFMDKEDFEQITIGADLIGDDKDYLAPNLDVTVQFHEGNPVMVELPSSVEVEVMETPPGIKGATATNQLKEAECSTGLKTKVPPFIGVGDRIRVSTSDGSYQARA